MKCASTGLVFAVLLLMVGCGGSSAPTSAFDGASEEAIADAHARAARQAELDKADEAANNPGN